MHSNAFMVKNRTCMCKDQRNIVKIGSLIAIYVGGTLLDQRNIVKIGFLIAIYVGGTLL